VTYDIERAKIEDSMTEIKLKNKKKNPKIKIPVAPPLRSD